VGRFTHHIFVCVNEREDGHPRGCCREKGGQEVRDAFKAQVKARKLQTRVRANNAGCLDLCEHGVTVVIYPEEVWYSGVTVDDVSEIMDSHIEGGVPVERLLTPARLVQRFRNLPSA